MKRILFLLFVVVSVVGMMAIESCNGCQRRSGSNHKPKPHGKYEYDIKGVRIGFDMTREDLHKVNKKANIVPKSRENNNDGKRYDYLVVNNKLAVTFDVEVSHINQIVIWDQTFVYNNIRVGDSFGSVMKKNNVNPNEKTTLTFIYLHSWFDYRMQTYTRAICAYDETTCTSYLFFESQFSSELWQGIMSAVGYVTSDKEFYLSALSSSTYASICSSVKLTQIVRWDCKCVENKILPDNNGSNGRDSGQDNSSIGKQFNGTKWKSDYYSTIAYNESLFDNKSQGSFTISNGDCIYYKFDVDKDFITTYSIIFYMNNTDIRNKYKVGIVENANASEGYIGSDDNNKAQINVTISMIGYLEMKNSVYVIIKNKK